MHWDHTTNSTNISPKIRQIIEKIRNYNPKRLDVKGLIPSAVLIPILSSGSIVFIKRNMKVKDHKGQIAFPGGMIEDSDNDPVTTALREAYEEINLPKEKVRVLGLIDDAVSIAGYIIHPVVGLIEYSNIEFKPNEGEVEKILIVKIEDIIGARYNESEGDLKCGFYINDIVIWGATGRILKNFLEITGLRRFDS